MSKKPRFRREPHPSKTPAVLADPESFYSSNPSWRIGKLQLVDPFGWHVLDDAKLHDIRGKLAAFESRRWNDILVKDGDHNHRVAVPKLCPEARKRLSDLHLGDIEELLSLRLSGKERVWGILVQGVLQLLWWDPEHKVCPSLLKHT